MSATAPVELFVEEPGFSFDDLAAEMLPDTLTAAVGSFSSIGSLSTAGTASSTMSSGSSLSSGSSFS
jgi:hypothetical protein